VGRFQRQLTAVSAMQTSPNPLQRDSSNPATKPVVTALLELPGIDWGQTAPAVFLGPDSQKISG